MLHSSVVFSPFRTIYVVCDEFIFVYDFVPGDVEVSYFFFF